MCSLSEMPLSTFWQGAFLYCFCDLQRYSPVRDQPWPMGENAPDPPLATAPGSDPEGALPGPKPSPYPKKPLTVTSGLKNRAPTVSSSLSVRS